MSFHIRGRVSGLPRASFHGDWISSLSCSRSRSAASRALAPSPARSRKACSSFVAPCAVLLASAASVACGAETDATEIEVLSSALTEGAEFVSVRKALTGDQVSTAAEAALAAEIAPSQARLAPDVLGSPDASGDFYVAIKKSSLGERWFLSAFMKQIFPDFTDVTRFGKTLGTRVVSFATQNDQLFVFDASQRFEFSAVTDPTLLVEAYPIVHRPEFDRLPGASDYVLFDPARGLNEFTIVGDVYGPSDLNSSVPLSVGASFMQNFRVLEDGAAFEQVFRAEDASGQAVPPSSVWGTLGVALRRYAVGDGYVPRDAPETTFYFLGQERSLPDSGGESVSNPVRWNIQPGMEPIEVLVTAGALRAQADFPEVDVLGAFERGVENWNDVFGFEALRAVQVDDDRVPDDDDNVILVDYPGRGAGAAFANWRSNPDNGEIRGGSVYFSGGFFDTVAALSQPPATPAQALASLTSLTALGPAEPRPAARHLGWGGMPEQEPVCSLTVPERLPRGLVDLEGEEPLPPTPAEQGARFVQYIVAHEMGHVLGLRHNFKGSLVPPSTSVMDYLNNPEIIATAEPQAYDRDAIRYLYGLSTDLPAQPFCTDTDVVLDPTCTLFDSGADPLTEYLQPPYAQLSEVIIDAGLPAELLDVLDLNSILSYARDAAFVDPTQRLLALEIALAPAAVPIPAERLENPAAVAATSAVADFVLRRAVLDPPELRGYIALDISDPTVIDALAGHAGKMLANADGIRSYELRRTAVDVLKRLQTETSLLALRSARDALRASLDGADVPTPDVAVAEDLLARIDGALTPYFE